MQRLTIRVYLGRAGNYEARIYPNGLCACRANVVEDPLESNRALKCNEAVQTSSRAFSHG